MKLTQDSKKIIKYYKDVLPKEYNNFSISKNDFNLIFGMVNSSYQKIKIKSDMNKSNSKKKTKKSVRLYLNNIDTCSYNLTKKNLKMVTI